MKQILRRTVCLVAGLSVTSLPLLAQYRESRIMEMDSQMKYAEALAMCEKSDDLPAAMYFAGDYYFHGRKGIPQDQEKGKTYYLKALNMLLPLAEGKDGDVLTQYRFIARVCSHKTLC